MYYYQPGCKTIYDPRKYTTVQKDIKNNIVDSRLFGEAIFNMLNFTDKKRDFLDCIILPPIRIGNAEPERGYTN
jgi:hypothetical protein